jgi:hypothetical protein
LETGWVNGCAPARPQLEERLGLGVKVTRLINLSPVTRPAPRPLALSLRADDAVLRRKPDDPSRDSALGRGLRVLACGGTSEKQLAVFAGLSLGFVGVVLVAFWFVGGLLD